MFRQKKAGIGNNCVYRWGMMGMCQITYEIPLCLRGLTFTCYLGLHWGTKSSFLGRLESDPFQIWVKAPEWRFLSKVAQIGFLGRGLLVVWHLLRGERIYALTHWYWQIFQKKQGWHGLAGWPRVFWNGTEIAGNVESYRGILSYMRLRETESTTPL